MVGRIGFNPSGRTVALHIMQTKPLDGADEHVKVLNWLFSKLQNQYEPAAGYLGRRNPRRYPNSYFCPRLSHRRAPASEDREGYERSAQRVHRPPRKTRFPPNWAFP